MLCKIVFMANKPHLQLYAKTQYKSLFYGKEKTIMPFNLCIKELIKDTNIDVEHIYESTFHKKKLFGFQNH